MNSKAEHGLETIWTRWRLFIQLESTSVEAVNTNVFDGPNLKTQRYSVNPVGYRAMAL